MDRLLFVDDEPFVLRALKRTFEMEGFEVVTASRPADAIELLRSGSEFQVIGSDYRMPEMNGAEFLQRARELAPQSYRLLISAVEEFGAALDAINRGEIYRLIPKPWNRDELIAIVRTAAEDWHLRRRYQEMTALLHTKNVALEALNRDLEDRVRDRTRDVLGALVSVLDARRDEAIHSRRTAALSLRLGRAMDLPPEQLDALEQAALLHDIGKAGISDELLRRQAPLTAAEMDVVRRHPETGYRMLANVPFLAAPRKIILQHHERWDGGGYPLGLAGEAIQLEARILAVAESYESMRSGRYGRTRLDHAAAARQMAQLSGTQFAPAVVTAFLAIPEAEWAVAFDSAVAPPVVEPDPALSVLIERARAGKL